jgi:hypothetical protein
MPSPDDAIFQKNLLGPMYAMVLKVFWMDAE